MVSPLTKGPNAELMDSTDPVKRAGSLTMHTTHSDHPSPLLEMTLVYVCGTLSCTAVPVGTEELSMSQDQLSRDISTDFWT